MDLLGVLLGGVLAILGSTIGQVILSRNEDKKWERNRKASLEDKRIDLKITVIHDRCDQIEKALRIYTQDFFHIDDFFQKFVRLEIQPDKLDSAKEFVRQKGIEMWKSRNPEIQESYNLNAIAYSLA